MLNLGLGPGRWARPQRSRTSLRGASPGVETPLRDRPSPAPAAAPPESRRAETCQGMIRTIAWQIHCRLPANIDLDDLIGYGQVGLAQAAQDYCEDRGARFETYAFYRIRGAILDGLSRMTWFKLADYHARRYERSANDVLALEAEEESAGEDDSQAAARFGRCASSLAVVYLASGLAEGGGAADVADPAARPPEDDLMMEELRVNVRALIDALPADAGTLMRQVYFEGLTLEAAAATLGKSKSWASRLHRRTIERLARAMRRLTGD